MCGNTRPAMRPTLAVLAVQTLIQHLELTRQLKKPRCRNCRGGRPAR